MATRIVITASGTTAASRTLAAESVNIGVEIEIRGETSDLQDQVEEIAGMIDSTTYRPAGQEENS